MSLAIKLYKNRIEKIMTKSCGHRFYRAKCKKAVVVDFITDYMHLYPS